MNAHELYTQQNPSKPTQHEISVATLPRLSRDELAARILACTSSISSASIPTSTTNDDSKLAVIDVRDNDYIGGHVKGCINVPSNTLDYKMPELVRQLATKETVVFHCALSQVRGPSAALKYMRERERLRDVMAAQAAKEGSEIGEQKVFVLEGGFTEWQQKYGEDTRLTEGYQKDIWAYGGY